MLLGKRSRPNIKRTTSITEFTVDLGYLESSIPSDSGQQNLFSKTHPPRTQRRNSADFIETAHFLRSCGLCSRRLAPGRDIFMYRGDTAFCSLECRQQQMNLDERKEKCFMVSKKEGVSNNIVGSETSSQSGTVAAA